jgi:hypothetical protein
MAQSQLDYLDDIAARLRDTDSVAGFDVLSTGSSAMARSPPIVRTSWCYGPAVRVEAERATKRNERLARRNESKARP